MEISTQRSGESAVPISRVAAASLVGTTVEFYDFFIFGTAAALVFNKLFFPNLSPLAGVLASFATFGVAFAARPLGAVIFGHFGDRIGRKPMLVVSLLMMGAGTVLIGLLPTYNSIGILAPILLVLCRLLQGLALGGEWGGAVLMAVEHAPKRRRAFYASWPQMGVPLGMVLATGVFFFVRMLPEGPLESWGWRIPFLLSAVLIVAGLYIRLKVEDSSAFRKLKTERKEERFPAMVVLKHGWRGVLIGSVAMAAANTPYYMAAVFALTYGVQDGIGANTVLGAVFLSAVVQIATVPYAGLLCDRFGRRPVLLAGAALTVLWGFPFFWLLDTHNVVAICIALIVALPIAQTMCYAPIASFLPEIFPTRLRYSGAGIAYNIGGLLFSAPVPFVAAALQDAFDSAWPLSLYIALSGVLTFAAVAVSRESMHDDIDWTDRPGESAGHEPTDEPAAVAVEHI